MKVKKILTIVLTLLGLNTVSALANEPMLEATPFSQIQKHIGKVPMMLEFGATSCHSCVKMGRLLYKLKAKYPKSHIYFIDIYKDKQSAKNYKIRMIPTQKYLDKHGKVVDTHMGVIDEDELEKKLKNLKIISIVG